MISDSSLTNAAPKWSSFLVSFHFEKICPFWHPYIYLLAEKVDENWKNLPRKLFRHFAFIIFENAPNKKKNQRNQPFEDLRRKTAAVEGGEEGQPHQSLVRTTFSSFSRPNHIEILVLSILFFLSVRYLKINTFFKNMATLGHKTWLE